MIGAKTILLAASLAMATTTTAWSQDLLTGADSQAVLDAAQRLGTADLSTQPNGDPVIDGRIDDTGYQIYFRNCTNNRDCEDLNFYAGFAARPGLDQINDWNRDKRFSRAYLDELGDAVVEMDLDLVQGVSEDYLAAQMDVWHMVVTEFSAHLGY